MYTVKNHAFVILGYGCNPRNAWFCTWCGTSVWKLYCKAIFCYRSVIYKRSQITIRSNVWATFQSTHDCRYDIEWLFKNDSHCLRTVCCNFYSSSCTRLCLAILFKIKEWDIYIHVTCRVATKKTGSCFPIIIFTTYKRFDNCAITSVRYNNRFSVYLRSYNALFVCQVCFADIL